MTILGEASSSPPSSSATLSTAASAPETRREDRDVVVNVDKQGSSDQSGPPTAHAEIRETENQTLERVNKALRDTRITALQGCTVGAAKLLPSGDWRLITATPRVAELLKIHTIEWVPTIGLEAKVASPTYGVIIDGIRISSISKEEPEKTIESLKLQNHQVMSHLEVERIRSLQKPQEGKQFALLVIDFTTPMDANAVIAAGELFWNNETRRVRRFVRSCSINQCYKCHKNGHRSTQCRNPSVCRFCAESDHVSAACPSQNQPGKAKCTLCGLPHPAWSSECKERKEEKAKGRARIQNASQYWSEPMSSTSSHSGLSSSASTFRVTGTKRSAPKDRPQIQGTDNPKTAPKKSCVIATPKRVPAQQQKENGDAELVDIGEGGQPTLRRNRRKT